MWRILGISALAGLAIGAGTTPATAQFSFSPERIFGYYDSDRDGKLDEDEIERVRGPLRETLERSGRESIDRDAFIRLMQEQRGGDDDDGDRDGNRSSQGRTGPKPRARVTLELPSKYTEGDGDGDGQIGLYEWIPWKSRAAIGEFLTLDRNRDGFLTPYELTIAEKSNGQGKSGDSRSTAARPGGTSATDSPGRGAAPNGDRPRLDEDTARIAREAFGNLAGEDNRISQEEWQRSQATRVRFEEAGVELKLPADLDSFLAAYPVQQNNAAQAATPAAAPPSTRDGREGSSRGRFSRGGR